METEDVPGSLGRTLVYRSAGRSLLSHLIKLEQDGQVARAEGEGWSALR